MATIRRAEPPSAPTGGDVAVPPEIAVGPLAEVWAADGADLADAHIRYARARLDWEAAEGLGPRSYDLLPGSAPWRLTSPNADARLARDGLTRADLPALRRAASEWITNAPREHR